MLTDAKRTAASDGASPLDSLVARLWRNAWAATDGLAGLSPWQVDRLTCETVFERLVREGFLYKTDGGAYTAQSPLRK
jgi:hypothetical protein